MTRLSAAVSVLALSLAACGDRDEPGDINSNIEPGESGALADLADEGEGDAGAMDGAAAPATSDAPALQGAWVRNPPGGRDMTAGYFTLAAGADPVRLVRAESPEAERVELHTMAMDGDVMRMRQVEAMAAPAGGVLTLAPGGDHLMIFGLAPEASADGALDVTLTFEDGRTMQTALPFADAAPDRAMTGMQGG